VKISASQSASLTVAIVLVLVFAKTMAYIFSGSTAVLASLMDSLSDIGLSFMTLLAVRWSLKPADEDHRHGHGKIEGVSALLQAAFLVGAASFLTLESLNRFLKPVAVTDHGLTAILMGFALVLSLALSFIQKRAAEQSGSVALKADHAHYATDAYLNGAVLMVILLSALGHAPPWLDPLCALFVAGLFLHAGYKIWREAFDMLMDRELPITDRRQIEELIRAHKQVEGFHDLRTYRSGMKVFISFDMEVDGNQSLTKAHDIARQVEDDLLKAFPKAEILIHLDPAGDTDDPRHFDV
jgi:ferrous-iron efflux pump FieF